MILTSVISISTCYQYAFLDITSKLMFKDGGKDKILLWDEGDGTKSVGGCYKFKATSSIEATGYRVPLLKRQPN